MANLEDFPINFLLAGLFIVAIFSWGIGMADDYGRSEDMITSPEYNYSEIREELESTNTQSDDWINSFREDNPTIYYGGIVLLSIWGAIGNVIGVTASMWTILSRGMHDVLGIDPLVFSILTTIIFILLIVLGWRKIKAGQ